jgi:hypothetical protein
MATLTYLTTVITLPEDLLWSDEDQWNPVAQTADRGITGALIVQAAAKIAGRSMTLAPLDEGSAWMSRSTLDALRNQSTYAGRQFVLNLRGVNYDVIFRYHDGLAVEARPVVSYSDVQADDWYLVTLRLMTV